MNMTDTVGLALTDMCTVRNRYLGHVTGFQPIRDQYFLIRSVPDLKIYILSGDLSRDLS